MKQSTMTCDKILGLLLVCITGVLLIHITNGVCVNNHSKRAIHAETFERSKCGGIFGNPCFSKRVNKDSKECCDSTNSDCWGGLSADDALYWIDRDTDSRDRQGYGQTVVACSACDITVYDDGSIVVTEEKGDKRMRAIQACKY